MVEIREGCELTDEALLAGLRGKVPNWWLPDEIIRLGSMPLAGTGKIDKHSLRDMCVTSA